MERGSWQPAWHRSSRAWANSRRACATTRLQSESEGSLGR